MNGFRIGSLFANEPVKIFKAQARANWNVIVANREQAALELDVHFAIREALVRATPALTYSMCQSCTMRTSCKLSASQRSLSCTNFREGR